MERQKLGNWRKMVKKSPYLAGHDVKIDEIGQTHIQLTITDVRFSESKGLKENGFFLILSFKEIDPATNKPYKDMLLNTTNSEVLEQVTGSVEPIDWIGHKIEITTKHGRWFGKETDALRITRRKIVKEKRQFDENSDRGKEIISKVMSGETTWDLIEKYYVVPKEVKDKYNG